jgi:hypothetical protein
MAHKTRYQAPAWLADHMAPKAYHNYIMRMGAQMVKRDSLRGGIYSVQEARDAIHQAFVICEGRDGWADFPLRADLVGKASNNLFKPVVDHRNSQPVADYVICSALINNMKGNNTIEETAWAAKALVTAVEAKASGLPF